MPLAAGTGLLGGGLYAVIRNGPYLRWALATSVSCVLCEATFCGETLFTRQAVAVHRDGVYALSRPLCAVQVSRSWYGHCGVM